LASPFVISQTLCALFRKRFHLIFLSAEEIRIVALTRRVMQFVSERRNCTEKTAFRY